MARMTTSRSAAAMRTAAVGDSPKNVVRSVTAARGRAAAPSSRRSSLFTMLLVLELERSELTLPDEELELDPGAGAGVAGADVELEDEDDPWASTSDTGAARTATPSRVANKAFIPHLLVQTGSKGGATERARPEGA